MRITVLKRWSSEDIRLLRTLAAQGVPAHRIAAELKRSEFAVRNKACMQGISLRPLREGVLKVDRSFVHKLLNSRASAICDAVVALGKGSELEAIVEGVETPEQLELFRQRECASVQDFLTGRPCDAAALDEELAPATTLARSGTRAMRRSQRRATAALPHRCSRMVTSRR